MDKISEFQITGMSISGFKCYAEPTELTFGNPTVITGGNGRGKSSVADAIAFAITGMPFFGERGIDRLHAEQNPDVRISLRFIDSEGKEHELTRTRQKSRMTITYDGYEIRQLDLTNMFGEKDVFLSIFNPLYFIEELGDGGKSLLERYLPAISHEEVLSGLSESVRDALKDEPLLSPETYLKKRREEIRELEETSIYLTGQKDLSDTQGRDAKRKLTDLTEKRDMLRAEASALESRQFEGIDTSAMRELLVDLSAQYDELARDARADGAAEYDARLAELNRRLGERKAERYAPKYAQTAAEITAKVKELGAKYSREAALYKGFTPGTVCPTCRRPVTEADIPVVQTALKQSIAEITAQGREQKAQLDELRALEQKTEQTFLAFQADDVKKLEDEIASIVAGRAEADANERGTELGTLRERIQALTSDLEYGNLTQAEYDRLQTCGDEMRDAEAELSALHGMELKSPDEYDAQLADISKQIAAKKRRIADVALYVSRRAELTFSQLRMNRVEISLYDVVKSTGEVKDTFKFTYSGRRYDRLSLSEKIRAGMEVSELMKRLTGRNYPVFTDNMESVDDLANVRPTGQLIMAKCVRGAPLSVKAVNTSAEQKAA